MKTAGSLPCGGMNNFTPSFGGRDCDRRWPIVCGSINLAGEWGALRSTSGTQVARVMKPVLQLFKRSGIRRRVVS